MTPLTVLHLNTEHGFRGGEIQNLHLAAGLAEQGHRCILAVQKDSPLGERAEQRGLEVRQRPMQGEFDPLAVAWLSRLIHEERPHILHYHTSHAVTLGTLARLGRRGPVAVATRRTSFPTRRNPLFRLKFSYRLDRVIAVSGSIRDDMVEAGLPAERITVVHSGIDLARFRQPADGAEFRREMEVPAEHLLLGCVGALAPQKGHGDLVQVLARLSDRFPNLHLAILGKGDMQEEILDEARNLGIGDRVHLAGFREDIPAANAAFDVAVLPSLAGEGSPAVVKEAMAAGVPVVATRIGGVAEILEDGRQGILVPPGDADALAAALESLLADPARRRNLGEAGKVRAEEFSMERMIRRTEEVYHELCHLPFQPGAVRKAGQAPERR
jgi:glycosyltransferase involved in cell wall biosynthesis